MVSFCVLSVSFQDVLVSCHVIEHQEIGFLKHSKSDFSSHYMHKLSTRSRVAVTLERNILLKLRTEFNIKKAQKQEH